DVKAAAACGGKSQPADIDVGGAQRAGVEVVGRAVEYDEIGVAGNAVSSAGLREHGRRSINKLVAGYVERAVGHRSDAAKRGQRGVEDSTADDQMTAGI